jgi:2-isopropylmalate synthase
VPDAFKLEHVQVSCGDHLLPTATVTVLTPDGKELTDAAVGTGPVDAVYKAINRVVNIPNQLTEFTVQSVTAGIDALGEVTIRLKHDLGSFSGHAANTDIVVASARAYINALNKLYYAIAQRQGELPAVESTVS